MRHRLPGPGRTHPAPAPLADPLQGSEAGLTLIEMIVALALGALVVAFLAQGTALLRHFARIGEAVSAQDEGFAVRDHLRRTVESTIRASGKLRLNSFAGVGDTLVFTVPGDRLLETGGPVRITLAAIPDGPGVALAETRASPDGSDSKGRTRRLVAGAERIAFSYYGSLSGEAAGWTAEWTDPESSPTLLRIDVTFRAGDRRRWPPFLVLMPSGGSPAPQSTASTQPANGVAKP